MTEKAFMNDETHATLDQAIAAARAGRRDDALRMLRQIVAADPFNADAWVWLGGIATDPREQRSALEQGLTVAPANQRAQQGLAWLRQTHPEVFETAESRPAAQQTASYELPNVYHTSSDAEWRTATSHEQQATYRPAPEPVRESNAAIYDIPARSGAATHEAPTEAMPTYRAQADAVTAHPGQQTDRMTAYTPLSTTTIDGGRTDRMATVPPPTAVPAEVVYRRSVGAEVARWLVLLTWLFVLGAVATSAAMILAFPNSFEAAVQPVLAIFRLRLVPADVEATRIGTAIALGALAVVDLMLILGMLFRGRWSWVFNALIATVAMLGAAALVGLDAAGVNLFSLVGLDYAGANPLAPDGFTLGSLAEQILGGLLAFTVVFFLLSLASRRAFFRRRVEQRA
ncbi:MAG TPA: hypothetical protein VFZ66_11035 [Herpetosiphonaceae bacterium]